MLINDNFHSYNQVIDVLSHSLTNPAPPRRDIDALTEIVDKEGRAILRVGTFQVNRKSLCMV